MSRHVFIVALWDLDQSIDDAEFNEWYESVHMPKRLACPGFVAGRRFRAATDSPRYMTIYELEDLGALQTPEFRSLYSTFRKDVPASETTVRMVDGMMNLVRNIFVELPSPIGQRPA